MSPTEDCIALKTHMIIYANELKGTELQRDFSIYISMEHY
jgi:hypothetical protein